MVTRLRRIPSSTIAIAAATLFVIVAATASFVAEDRVAVGRDWTLRGALIPVAEAHAIGAR